MRKFLIGLACFALLLSTAGSAVYPTDDAEAGKAKLVWIKCKATHPPVYKGTKVPCSTPGMWRLVSYKWAVSIGAYPIIFRHTTTYAAEAAYRPDTIITESYFGEGAQYVVGFTAANINSPNYAIEFECRVDRGEWYACGLTPGLPTYEYLNGFDSGKHRFRVRTVFRGETDPTPARVVFELP